MTTVGVEERVWRHTRFGDKGDKYVTVIIDLTPARTKTEHVEVEATWGIYQRMIAAYREPDKKLGKQMMQAVIDTITTGVPTALVEIRSPTGGQLIWSPTRTPLGNQPGSRMGGRFTSFVV